MLKDAEGNKIWKPSLKQEKFLQIPLSVKEGFYAGAVNAGKSDVLLMYPLVWGWHLHPQFKGLFLRRTKPELRNEIIPRALDYFRPFGASFNATTGIFTFPSGAMYFFGHCEHEKDVHDYDSMQPNYAAFDELTSFTEWIYLYITIERVRVNKNLQDELPMIVRSGSNPGNIGHPWVYKRFIKPYKEGGRILRDPRSDIKRVFIPATIDDNPYASEQYKRELDALPEAERKAKKYGDWDAYEGQVFDEFRDKPFPGEPKEALHVIPEFDIPEWWPKLVAIDWGFNAMNIVGFAAVSPDERVYVYRTISHTRTKIEDWTTDVKPFIEKEKPQSISICHSANQNRGDPHTILEQVSDALGVSINLGPRDRVGTKSLVHEYLRWRQKDIIKTPIEKYDPEQAAFILRNKGVRVYKQYIESFSDPEPELNLPRLQIFDNENNKLITEALKACIYEKSETSGKKKEDVAEFDGDDPYDMLRILLNTADEFFSLSSDVYKKLQAHELVLNKLKENNDMTAFYRNMRKVESLELASTQPVVRYNNRRGFYNNRSFHR